MAWDCERHDRGNQRGVLSTTWAQLLSLCRGWCGQHPLVSCAVHERSKLHDTPGETLHYPGLSHVGYRYYSSSSSSASSTGSSNVKKSSFSSSSCPSARLSSDVSRGSMSSSSTSTSSKGTGRIATSGSSSRLGIAAEGSKGS